MKLCEWCEQPVQGENELCNKCLEAQARVAAGLLIPTESEKKKSEVAIGAQVGRALIFVGKVIAAIYLGGAMVALALLGTCLSLATVGSLIYNPLLAILLGAAAALVFWFTTLLYGLTKKMFEAPLRPVERKIQPAKPVPPFIEDREPAVDWLSGENKGSPALGKDTPHPEDLPSRGEATGHPKDSPAPGEDTGHDDDLSPPGHRKD